jgi:hypothetical protein
MKADHVVFCADGDRVAVFQCRHCAASYRVNMPVPITMFAVIAKEFTRLHAHCMKPQNEKPKT